MSGPAVVLLIFAAILGVFLLATAGVVLSRRRVRLGAREAEVPTEAPPVEEMRPPSTVTPEAPPDITVAEPSIVETQPPPPVEVEAPAAEDVAVVPAPPVAEAPKRRRVRGIGASIARLFRGTSLSDDQWEELEETLLRADVGVVATTEILEALRARPDASEGVTALRAELVRVLGSVPRELSRKDDGLTVWLITGVNGVGKTTTIGKLAARLRREGTDVVLAAADTFRAAADEQLQRWADLAGATVVKHPPGGDPAAVVFDGVKMARQRNAGAVIVDTAGRLQTKKALMDELSKIRRVLEREAGAPDEVLLVLDATTGQNGLQQARAFADAAQITGLVLTKLDGTAKGGIVIAVQRELGIPVKLVGLGEGIDDLALFEPEQFVDDLLSE